MSKILFLTPEFPPSKLTGAIRPAKFAKYLSRFGWDVTVLTFDHKDDAHQGLLKDLTDVRIEKCGIPKKIIVNDLGVAYLFQAFKQAVKLTKEEKPDYILVSMPTFMNSLLALYLNKKFGTKYLLDYRDLWVADPYPVRGIKSKVFRLLSKVIEPFVLKSAFLSYYVSQEMLNDQLIQYPFLHNKNTLVISTGYDPEDIADIQPSLEPNGYISHIGNADIDMNLDDFVNLVKNKQVQSLLLEKKLKFLFVGRKNKFMQDALDSSLLRFFEFKDYIPHKEALQLMADSSGLLILGSDSGQRLNRKVFEYTALNNNVFYLGNIESPTAKIVRKCGGSFSNVTNLTAYFIDYLQHLSTNPVSRNSGYTKPELVRKLIEKLSK
ncbi:hypothetical protein J8L73_10325 [Pseudoalteromonas sp. MMG006]|uniref:glycosyltransferase n=1 Tax=Pseudoalteromonas sp. MMG006 TaxID=2822683 RepID=UPI001B3638B1|nr:glycosyltransferase [Pseudoalteromonas sp. MMG006]MBQ4799518.1 hypothetical protein [Pseudoalteromonas sp. MMG006]